MIIFCLFVCCTVLLVFALLMLSSYGTVSFLLLLFLCHWFHNALFPGTPVKDWWSYWCFSSLWSEYFCDILVASSPGLPSVCFIYCYNQSLWYLKCCLCNGLLHYFCICHFCYWLFYHVWNTCLNLFGTSFFAFFKNILHLRGILFAGSYMAVVW